MSEVLRHGVPTPFEWEAPSSWLGRLSMAQGCTVEEVKRFLGCPSQNGRDVDSVFFGPIAAAVRHRCGLPGTAFRRAETAAEVMKPRWRRASGWPRFFYCPLCLAARETAYLDIYWRCLDVRLCLVHGVDLEEWCLECRSPISAPTNVFTSHAGRSGYASQSRCQKCSCDLGSAPARQWDRRRPMFTNLELQLLAGEDQVPAEVPVVIRSQAKAISAWPWWPQQYLTTKAEHRLAHEQALARNCLEGPLPTSEFVADRKAVIDGTTTNEEAQARAWRRAGK